MLKRSFLFLIIELLSLWYTAKGFACTKCSGITRREHIARRVHEIWESDEELFLGLMNDEDLQNGECAVQENDVKDAMVHNMDRYEGAGVPRPELAPEDLVPLLMNALKNNDIPNKDVGLQSMWEFTTDTTKYIFKNNITGED